MPRVLWSDPDKTLLIKETERPTLAPHQVRVRTHFSYISAGTELTQLQLGRQVNAKRVVRAAPLGYSVAGEVVEVGDAVEHVRPGQRVVSIGEGAFHADEVVVATNLTASIPDDISSREAAPAAMMCFALEGVRKAGIAFGEHVLVTGGGLMGQFASQLALASGARVFLTDSNPRRLAFARDGVEVFENDDAGWTRLRELVHPTGIEAAIVCAGGEVTGLVDRIRGCMSRSPDGIAHGRIVFSGGATATIPFASPSGNIRFYSSAKAGPGYRDPAFESGHGYPPSYVQWTVTRNLEVALRAVSRGQLQISPLITHEFSIDEATTAYGELLRVDSPSLAVLFRYDREPRSTAQSSLKQHNLVGEALSAGPYASVATPVAGDSVVKDAERSSHL